MKLRKIAAKFEKTSFDAYDEDTQTWSSNALQGKTLPVDRFLSNFHRPTRRRMLGADPAATLPASYTIRDPATLEMYILGERRQDARVGRSYDSITVMHKVSETCTITRKSPVGPSNDPGHLVSANVGHHYLDVELRAGSEIEEQQEEFEGNYFVILPPHADLQEWDFLTVGSITYFIQKPYIDSGFVFARAINRVDPRKDFTYHYKGTSADYDPSTRTVTDGFVDYDVTGFAMDYMLEELPYVDVKGGDIQVIVKQAHIGIVPTTEDELTWEGQRYKVARIKQDFLNNQYQLHCTL